MASDLVGFVRVTPSDLDTLVRISRKIFYESFHHQNSPENMTAYMDRAFNPDRLLSEINNPNSEFYFLGDAKDPIGYIKLNRSGAQSDINDEASLEIERIYVDIPYQGKGLGAKLIEKAKERAQELNLKYVWLGVWEKNTDAIRFYERHGFKAFGNHAFQMGDDLQTDVLMRCELSP